ncbi:MAG: hypothetical protein JWQ01_2610 [Massilia sp.]|nr:hypothetical protein [Massilia sp.]
MSIPDTKELERLHGLKFDANTLTLWVRSTGYTNKEYFKVDVQTGFTGEPLTIAVLRLKEDSGKMMPHIVEVEFSWDELGVRKQARSVEVLNKLGLQD